MDEPLPRIDVPIGRVIAVVLVACFFAGAVVYFLTTPRTPGPGSVDVGFYRDMTVHHDQAVVMSGIELDNGTNPVVRGFASEIILEQRWELGRMYDTLLRWGADVTPADPAMAWMGMPVATRSMPGLATPDQIQELRHAKGADADALFLELMAEHHRGGIHMASYASRHASDSTVRTVAATMARNQTVDISEFIQTAKRYGLDADIAPAPATDPSP
jgi:uncharacterized protein (DUF305 family)